MWTTEKERKGEKKNIHTQIVSWAHLYNTQENSIKFRAQREREREIWVNRTSKPFWSNPEHTLVELENNSTWPGNSSDSTKSFRVEKSLSLYNGWWRRRRRRSKQEQWLWMLPKMRFSNIFSIHVFHKRTRMCGREFFYICWKKKIISTCFSHLKCKEWKLMKNHCSVKMRLNDSAQFLEMLCRVKILWKKS